MYKFFYCLFFVQCIFGGYSKKYVKKKSIKKLSRKRVYTKWDMARAKRYHEELKKKSFGDMYMIQNSHGIYSISVQNHFNYDAVGYASYYDTGHITSTGEKFNTEYYTAAHPFVPLPCVAEVSLVSNPKRKVIVKINDRGPFHSKDCVIIDLTRISARELGYIREGLAQVRVRVLKKETAMLKEHGGPIKWSGKNSWYTVCRYKNGFQKKSFVSQKRRSRGYCKQRTLFTKKKALIG